MKIQKLFASAFLTILFISLLISYTACLKEPNPPGNTTIFYTDVTPDSIILQAENDTFKLDVNNDGIPDFEFRRSRTVLCDDDMLGTWAYTMEISVRPSSTSNAVLGNLVNVPLDISSAINADSVWTSNPVILLSGGTAATGHCITSLPAIEGNWLDQSDKYIGLKVEINNSVYYGWAKFSSSYSRAVTPSPRLITSGQFILAGYAVNSIPNQPILAGQTR